MRHAELSHRGAARVVPVLSEVVDVVEGRREALSCVNVLVDLPMDVLIIGDDGVIRVGLPAAEQAVCAEDPAATVTVQVNHLDRRRRVVGMMVSGEKRAISTRSASLSEMNGLLAPVR